VNGWRRKTAGAPSAHDARLMAEICSRNISAFEELYRTYHPGLTRFLINLVHRPQIVEEVLDDTMMAIWNKPESFRGESRLSTWIFAIAYRKAMKAIRRHDDPVEDRDMESRPDESAGPDEQWRRQQVQAALLDAMGQLSNDHRTVVDLTYFHEMGYREIAEIMGCPVNTVKTRMFHARRQLQQILTGGLTDWLQD
jgi:RNA polymerase sigma-70 factor (ECF subfamily)